MSAYDNYAVDLAGASFREILVQTTFLLADNAGFLKFAARNSNAIKMGGLKDMKVYRTIFNKKFLEGKSPNQRAGFLAVVASTAVVQTKSRVARVVKTLDNGNIKTSAAVVLGSFRDNRNQTNDIDTFLVINLRTAYPEIIMLVRMVNSELAADKMFKDAVGNDVVVPEWFMSPCAGQLSLDPSAQETHKNYMQYFWTEEVTGPGSGWDAESAGWYDRTTAMDLMLLPEYGGVTADMTGPDAAGNLNCRYTMTDLRKFAREVTAVVGTEPALAATHVFAQN